MSGRPWYRWKTSHIRKISHRYRLGAYLHRWRVLLRYGYDHPMDVYPCRWQDDQRLGETARRHWHIGRSQREPLRTYQVLGKLLVWTSRTAGGQR